MAIIKGRIMDKMIDDEVYALNVNNVQRQYETRPGLQEESYIQQGPKVHPIRKGMTLDNRTTGSTSGVSAYPRQVPLEIPWKKSIFESSN